MITIKKFTFFPIYILFLYFTLWQFDRIYSDLNILLSLKLIYLFQFIYLIILLIFSSLFFVLSLTFSNNWKTILPFIILASLTPFLIFPFGLAVSLCLGMLISKCLVYLLLDNKLKTYINFQPTAILIPYIKLYITLLIIILSVSYYYSMNQQIKQKGLVLPDSLIETIIKITPLYNIQTQSANYLNDLPPIFSNTAQAYANNLLVKTVRDETQKFIAPYIDFVAPTLTLIFFLSAISFASILNILLYPLTYMLFKLLEKTRFISFKKEMREVKKLVI